jgi:2,4-dienoyl-CoA reductase (NADPH2)
MYHQFMNQSLFSPLKISGRELKNRVIAEIPSSFLANEAGDLTQDMIDYYERIAATNVSMVITEPFAVDKNRLFAKQPGISNTGGIFSLSRISERTRAHKAIPILQLFHPGINAKPETGLNYVYGPARFKHSRLKAEVRQYDFKQIAAISGLHIDAAISAWNSGYSGIEVNGADGGLIQQFLSPITNLRADDYGYKGQRGEKLALEIVKAIRKTLPDFLIIFKLSTRDLLPGGRMLKEALNLAMALENAGVDMIHVTAGFTIGKVDYAFPTGRTVANAPFAPDCAFLKKHLKIPLILSGKIALPGLAEEIIRTENADVVSLGRTLNRDLDWLNIAAMNSEHVKVRECKRCPNCSAASTGCPDMKGYAFWKLDLDKHLIRRKP